MHDILARLGVDVVTIAVLGFLFKNWLLVRLKESVSDEYKRALEKFKEDQKWETRRREEATKVAEILSLWIQGPYLKNTTPEDNNARLHALQGKYWELALWLDPAALRSLNATLILTGAPGEKHKEALIAVRRLIVGAEDDIAAKELVHWNPLPFSTP